MAGAFGISFSLGAVLSPTVTSVLSTVSRQIRASASNLSDLERRTAALSEASRLRGEVARLQSLYAAGGGQDRALREELDRTIASYRRAQGVVSRYGISVADYERELRRANSQLAANRRHLEALNRVQAHQNAAGEYGRRAMQSALPAVAMLAPIAAAVKFESAMADATKTIPGMRDGLGKLTPKYHELEKAVLRMGRTLPIAHTELAQLFAIGGQQGIESTKDLEQFATMAAHMGVAFGMSSEQAADAIGTYRTALGLAMPDVRSMLDLMNQYAATGTASEKGIAEIVRRVGSLGSIGGVAAKPMTALAATLDAVGVAPEIAGTGIKNMILALTAGTAATKTQEAAFAKLGINTVELAERMQKDGPAAIVSVLEAVKKLPKAQQLSLMSQLFGKESLLAISPMLDKLDLVKSNLMLAGDATAYAGAMQEEFENRNRTTEAALISAKNRLSELGITLGTQVLPAVVSVLEVLSPAISAVTNFATENTGLTAAFIGVSAGALILRPLILGGMAAYHGIAGAIGLARAGTILLTSRLNLNALAMLRARAAAMLTAVGAKIMAAGQWALNLALSANPIGVVIMALGALGAWFATCYSSAGSLTDAIGMMWEQFKAVVPAVHLVENTVTGVIQFIKDIFNGISLYDAGVKLMNTLGDGIRAMWDGIVAPLKKLGSWLGIIDEDTVAPETPAQPKSTTETQAQSNPVAQLTAAISPTVNTQDSASPLSTLQAAAQPSNTSTPPASMGTETMPTQNAVTANFSFTLNGVTDKDFAQRVVTALNAHKHDLEKIVSDIVNDQARLAYGN